MSREDAVRLILIDFCDNNRISPTEFGRNSNVSKSSISKIMNHKYGHIGISGTILGLIANGMGIELCDLEKLIEAYQNGSPPKTTTSEKVRLIALINSQLEQLNESDLEVLHSIILAADSKALKNLDIILKNMK